MALLSCPGWGNDGDRTLLEEMKAYGSRYTAALRCDVFAADDADTHLEEVTFGEDRLSARIDAVPP